MKLNLNIPEFERYTNDQQFVNVVKALDRMETRKGGLKVQEIWGMAWQVVELLKTSSHPDSIAKILLTHISSQIEEKLPKRTKEENIHTTHSVLFCVNYLLCANDEEPDPNQNIIDNISEQLSQMPDIAELFYAVECDEDAEEAKGHKVKERNVLGSEKLDTSQGQLHQLEGNEFWIVQELEVLVSRGVWLKGLTDEKVLSGLKKALAIKGPGLNTKEMVLSNKLWALLRHRKGQKSNEAMLRITWLNIVGYCVRHGMLEGSSKHLLQVFYPNLNLVNDDKIYKNIDRGRKPDDLYSFKEIEPLLDTYLKPKE